MLPCDFLPVKEVSDFRFVYWTVDHDVAQLDLDVSRPPHSCNLGRSTAT